MEPQAFFNAVWDPVNHILRCDRKSPGAAPTSNTDAHGILGNCLGGGQNFTDTIAVVPNEGAAG